MRKIVVSVAGVVAAVIVSIGMVFAAGANANTLPVGHSGTIGPQPITTPVQPTTGADK